MLADGCAPLRYVASPPAQTGTNAPNFQNAVATAQAATGALSPFSGPQAIAPVYRDWANVEAIVAAQYRIAWSQPDPQKAVALLDQQYAGYLQHEGLSTRFFAGVVAFAKAQGEPASSPTLNADFHAADKALSAADLHAVLQYKFGRGHQGPYTAAQIQAAVADLNNLPAWKVAQTLNDPSFGTGSPESAANGAAAALDLLSTSNPYFYSHLLFQTDAGYSPSAAKAQAFLATLSAYEQKGDTANIAQLLNALGPDQAAALFADAGRLTGPQYSQSGSVVASDQTGVDQVLSKALLAPGVQLGDDTQRGTLAYSLLHPQSGSDALAIAGILNQSGTGPRVEALKQAFVDQIEVAGKALGNPDSYDGTEYTKAAFTVIDGDPTLLSQYDGQLSADGIFGANGASVPADERTTLNGIRFAIDHNLYPPASQGNSVPTGIISQSTMYDIQQYLSGKIVDGDTGQIIGGDETPAQRFANLMSVLGPDRTYAVLANMTPEQAQQLGIQNSLNTLTSNLQFTGDDAKALALAQAHFATSESLYDFPGIGWVGHFINSLPNDQAGTAVKVGYAEGSVTAAQQLAQEIASGKYSGQQLNQLTATLNGLLQNATSLSAGFPDPVKLQLFQELHAAATQLTGPGAAQQRDVLNAYAAGILGTLSDKSQIAAVLRGMGGVGADGAIDPNSDLAKFLTSALRGQSQFGIASWFGNNMTPNGQGIKGVTSLLNGLAGSGDTKLMAGTLDTVMQWTIHNPTQAEVLAAQDTGSNATGYREALTNLLDKSFNQFVALDPADPNATLVRSMQNQTIADLQTLSAVEMGPPYNSKIAGDFAGVIGKHVTEFAAYAEGDVKDPALADLNRLFAGIGDTTDQTQRHASASVAAQVMGAFNSGLEQMMNSAQAQATKSDIAAAINAEGDRIITDYLRGAGTTVLLLSAWVTGGTDIPIGLGATATGEKLASIFGRIGLAGGSWGTLFLDMGQQNGQQTEQNAIQAVRQGMQAADLTPMTLMQGLFDGFYSKMTQLPGKGDQGDENQEGLTSLQAGYAYAFAPEPAVNLFISAYNPMGYYHDRTGQYPSAS